MAIELADKLYTSTQVADILGVSLRTLYRYMEDDKIKSMRTASGRHRFTKDHIIEFLNAGRGGMGDEMSSAPAYGSPRNSGYPNMPQNQGMMQNGQRGGYYDNAQVPVNNMPNPYASGSNFSGMSQPAQTGNNMYGREDKMGMNTAAHSAQGNMPNQQQQNQQPQQNQYNSDFVVEEEDDFEFDVTSYDYDSDVGTQQNQTSAPTSSNNYSGQNSGYGSAQQSNYAQSPVQPQAQPAQQQAARQDFSQSTYAPPASTSAPEVKPEPMVSEGAEANINVRYYKSDYSDLIELAKKIKDTSNAKDLEYAFTLYAGLSLHFLIRPFTVLNFYANPEDMQLWKDELRLVPTQRREEANVGIIINTDIVFVPTREIGGFKVVEDKILLKDLSASKEEDLVKQFRQHLTSI